MVFNASEYMDSTPNTRIDSTKLRLRQLENDTRPEDIFLSDPKFVAAVDGYTITLQISETHRYRGVQMSGTPGGDNKGVYIEILSGFATDIAQVPNNNQTLLVTEYDDIIGPTITSAVINYTDGTLRIFGSETIDSDPYNNTEPALIRIVNQTGEDGVHLAGTTVIPSELPSVDLVLTELQRVEAIATSNTPGGDGGANLIDMISGAIVDIATAPSPNTYGIN